MYLCTGQIDLSRFTLCEVRKVRAAQCTAPPNGRESAVKSGLRKVPQKKYRPVFGRGKGENAR